MVRLLAVVGFAVAMSIAPALRARAQSDLPKADAEKRAENETGVKRRAATEKRRKENYIGVFTSPLSEPLAAQLSQILARSQGLLVTGVIPGSPAEKSGIRRDDVLASYDDLKLTGADQLRRLIVGDKPSRAVRLGIVRRARRDTLEVILGSRSAVVFSDGGARRVIRFPGDRQLLNGRGIVIRRNSSGDAPSLKKKFGDKPGKQGTQGLGVVITSQIGQPYSVKVSFAGEDGKRAVREFNGTVGEIHKKAGDLPPDARDNVRESLGRIHLERVGKGGGAAKRGARFRFQLQPKIDGEKRQLRLRLEQPGREKGTLRVLELDFGDGLTMEFDIEELLESELLKSELEQLPREVRRRVESTLRKTRIPVPTVQVRKSQ